MRGQLGLALIAIIFLMTVVGVYHTTSARAVFLNQVLTKDIQLEDAIELQKQRTYLKSAAFTALMEEGVCGIQPQMFDDGRYIGFYGDTPTEESYDSITESDDCFNGDWDEPCYVALGQTGTIYFDYTWNEDWHAQIDYPVKTRQKIDTGDSGYASISCLDYDLGEWTVLREYTDAGVKFEEIGVVEGCYPSLGHELQFRVSLTSTLFAVKFHGQNLNFTRENPYWLAREYAVDTVNGAAAGAEEGEEEVLFGNQGHLITRKYSVDHSSISVEGGSGEYRKVKIDGDSLNIISDELRPEIEGRLDFFVDCSE